MYGIRSSLFLALACLLACGSLSSCARLGQREKMKADTRSYAIIEEKQTAALGEARPFTLEEIDDEATQRLLERAARIRDWSEDTYTTPSYLLNLSDTLAIALVKSRDYQTRKEQLFSNALSLMGTRWEYGPIFSASAGGEVTRAQTPDDGVETFGTGRAAAGVRRSLATGGEVSLRFTKNFLHYFTGDSRESSTNSASFGVVQPLLNGAGPLVAREGLRQAERDMIYAVRDFQRYQQSFIIRTASSYYQLLQQIDRLENERLNYRNALMDLERAAMLTLAGRMAKLELDQTRQRVLNAENRWTNAQTELLGRLDQFKLDLGIPVDLDVGPDPEELDDIRGRDLVLPDIDLNEAVELALVSRLDLMTAADRTSDTARGVRIALRNFLPSLNARYEYNTATTVDDPLSMRMDLQRNNHIFGLDLALPLDWTPRRIRYRRALIAHDQSQRRYEEARDRIVLEVRESWRQLERVRKTFEIQKISVDLAERRVESTNLLLESGAATARDLIEAQDALVGSRNALTDALVSYTIRRLEFWNTIERLKIDPRGMWYE